MGTSKTSPLLDFSVYGGVFLLKHAMGTSKTFNHLSALLVNGGVFLILKKPKGTSKTFIHLSALMVNGGVFLNKDYSLIFIYLN
jgi:hypothetical protein